MRKAVSNNPANKLPGKEGAMKYINKYCKLKNVILIAFALIFIRNVSTAQSMLPQWIQQSRVTDQTLNAVCFTDNLNGVVVGNAGTILYTTNAGEIWLTIPGLTKEDLNDVAFLNASTGVIVGNNGLILVTNNWGSCIGNWRQVNSRVAANLNTVTFATTDLLNYKAQVFAAGNDGLIICSIGSFDEWDICTKGQMKYNGVSSSSRNKIWVVGDDGLISVSNDAGTTFISQKSHVTNRLNQVFMLNDITGFITGEKNLLLYTENGGREWKIRSTVDNYDEKCSLNGIYFSKSAVWTVCSEGDIYMSQDLGLSWIEEINPVQSSLNDVCFSDDIHGWAVGSKGVILYRCDICDIKDNINLFQSGLEQNSPNPFNPSTSITFRVAESGLVSLKIYDLTGKEITTLINQNLMPGVYQTEWFSADYASGVYFYTLKTEKFYETKRMVLIK